MEKNVAAVENVAPVNPAINPVKPKQSSPLVKILTFFVIILIIVLIGVVAYVLGSKKTETPITTPTPIAVKTPAPTIEATAPTSSASAAPTTKAIVKTTPIPTIKVNTNPNLKTFSSDALKISFDYLEVQPDNPKDKIAIKQVGNKVFVNFASYTTDGQYVEVFKKDKADTLEQAVKKQFLTGISDKDCFVVNSNVQTKFPATYKAVEISFPYDPNSDIPMFATENKCPQTYTQSNGVSYFLGDSNHPEIFLFFSIGQYGIFADGAKMWQETIKFL